MSPRRPKAVVAAGSTAPPSAVGTPLEAAGASPLGPGGLERRSPRRPKAVVAMSGGVDSSVAAALLVERGYDVTGVMLKLWRSEGANTNSGCCSLGAAEDARRVADTLGIPFYVLNFADLFEGTVVADFDAAYAGGTTPNPCVRCNQWVKFGALTERAEALGAEVLATGHYARVRSRSGRFRLLRGADPAKDQSYVLWMLSQRQLARTLFPVGEMPKTETRRLAGELGLRTAAKADSQEICFVRNGDVASYVADNIPEGGTPGPIRDSSGAVLGEHRGIAHYTVGQRRGLGISLGVPVFVTAIEPEANTIVVGRRDELGAVGLGTRETSWVDAVPEGGRQVLVQHRAHGDVAAARVMAAGGSSCRVSFDAPVEAIAPGQSAAFYSFEDPDMLLGGGIIASVTRVQGDGGGDRDLKTARV